MVLPTRATDLLGSLNANEAMVAANTNPADVTTEPVAAMARMIPVFRPPGSSSRIADQQQIFVIRSRPRAGG